MVEPLSDYFMKKFAGYEYESNDLFKRPILPYIMKKRESQGDMFIQIYSMDGLNKIKNYNEILNEFYYQAGDDEGFASTEGFQDSIFSLAFILDADDKGIQNRVDFIKDNYTDTIPEIENIGHGKENIVKTQKNDLKLSAVLLWPIMVMNMAI